MADSTSNKLVTPFFGKMREEPSFENNRIYAAEADMNVVYIVGGMF